MTVTYQTNIDGTFREAGEGGAGGSGYGRERGIEAVHVQPKVIFADLSGAKVADPFAMR